MPFWAKGTARAKPLMCSRVWYVLGTKEDWHGWSAVNKEESMVRIIGEVRARASQAWYTWQVLGFYSRGNVKTWKVLSRKVAAVWTMGYNIEKDWKKKDQIGGVSTSPDGIGCSPWLKIAMDIAKYIVEFGLTGLVDRYDVGELGNRYQEYLSGLTECEMSASGNFK